MATTLLIEPEITEAVVEKAVTMVTVSPKITGAIRSWFDYVSSYSEIPTLIATISDGDVYRYVYSNLTLYRLVPSGNLLDSFYSNFDGSTLSGLVSERVL